jgi:glycerol-1-phosphate dehydrogenase [NAD(P)+]
VNNDILKQLLNGRYRGPDYGTMPALTTRTVLIEKSLAGMERDAVTALELGRHLAIVSDSITHPILGRRIERALCGSAAVGSIVLPHPVHADSTSVERVRNVTRHADALIAVGSGTINDLCKYASALDNKPYAVFATAPSMNGYTSVNAAITVAGHKKSLPAQAAQGVFMDLEVLAAAPPRMIRAGLGDSLCRPTAQADWLLAYYLRGDSYQRLPFDLLAPDEADLFAEPQALLAGDIDAMERLARTLVLSGFGMTLCGGSYPASQGEHLISHYTEMLGNPEQTQSLHGEQIAVTTLTMARLQEQLLNGETPFLSEPDPNETDLIQHFGKPLGRSCWQEFSAKRFYADQRAAINEKLTREWPQISEQIRAVTIPEQRLEQILKDAGAPTRPGELGWSRDFYRAAVGHAREIRNRYTFLDLAAGSGRLAGFVEHCC